MIAAQALKIARAALEYVTEYATRIEAARLLTQRASSGGRDRRSGRARRVLGAADGKPPTPLDKRGRFVSDTSGHEYLRLATLPASRVRFELPGHVGKRQWRH